MASTRDVKRSAEFLTVTEVADRLRVTERFIRRLIASGELEAVKVGSRVIRIRSADIDALLSPVHRAWNGATKSQPARHEASRPTRGLGIRVMRRSG
jgi:excisionase family DNA binding protein